MRANYVRKINIKKLINKLLDIYITFCLLKTIIMSHLQHKRIEKNRYLVRNNKRQKKLCYLKNLINEQNDIAHIDLTIDIIIGLARELPNELINKIYMMFMCQYHNRHILDSTGINCICCNKHIEHFCHDMNVVIEPNKNINQMIGFMKRISHKNIFMCSQFFPIVPLNMRTHNDLDHIEMYHEMNQAIKKEYKFDHQGPLFLKNNNFYVNSYSNVFTKKIGTAML